MGRTLVLAVSGLTCAVVWGFVRCDATTRAQAQAGPRIELVVRAQSSAARRCFEVDALRQRISHYGQDRLARARDLRLELEVDAPDSAQLLVYRGSELVSRRRFEDLPRSCTDRRDTVALSIALALDGVIRALMPDGPTGSTASSPVDPAGPTAAPNPPAAEPRESGSRWRDANDASTTESSPVERVVGPQPSAARPTVPPAERAEPNAAEPNAAEPAPEPELEAEADPEPEADSAAPSGGTLAAWTVKLHAGGRWLAHALPSPVWTGLLGAELWVERAVAVELSAIASTLGSSTLARGRVQTRLIGGEVLGCYAVEFDGFAAQGCGGALAAWCRARGRDYAVPFPAATLLWAAATARVALLWAPQEVVSLRLVIQGHVNLVRPELRVDGSAEQLEPFWLGGAVGLDLVVSFD